MQYWLYCTIVIIVTTIAQRGDYYNRHSDYKHLSTRSQMNFYFKSLQACYFVDLYSQLQTNNSKSKLKTWKLKYTGEREKSTKFLQSLKRKKKKETWNSLKQEVCVSGFFGRSRSRLQPSRYTRTNHARLRIATCKGCLIHFFTERKRWKRKKKKWKQTQRYQLHLEPG